MKALPTGLSTRSKSLPTRSIFCIRAALDVPLAKLFDYSVPAGMEARVGDRVVVPFGARQRLGVVLEGGVTSELPAARVKPIVALRDDAPRLPADWLELIRFLSGYYQRPLGETVISALPPRLRSVKPLPRKALQSATAPGSARFVPNHSLNAAQTRALDRMASALGSFSAFLLHGVTGSGKTEVYLHLIARVLARGGQALILVPEISLTPQLEAVFRQAFPETRLALLHSGLEDVAANQEPVRATSSRPLCNNANRVSGKAWRNTASSWGVRLISGTRTSAWPPRASTCAMRCRYTSVFPLPVTPCSKNALKLSSARAIRSRARACAALSEWVGTKRADHGAEAD